MATIEQLPLPPSVVGDTGLIELDRLTRPVDRLSLSDWQRPSAVEGWTDGDVVTHLDLFVGIYDRMLGTVTVGAGSTRVARTLGWLTGSVTLSVAPLFQNINGALSKVVNRMLAAETSNVNSRCAQHPGATAADRSGRLQPPVYFEGGRLPLSFYLAMIVNELSIHRWDIESTMEDTSGLSEEAPGFLSWFYSSGSRLLLRPSETTTGTVQVLIPRPESTMWWTLHDRVGTRHRVACRLGDQWRQREHTWSQSPSSETGSTFRICHST